MANIYFTHDGRHYQMSIEPEVFKLFPLLGLLTEVAPPTPPKLPERPKTNIYFTHDGRHYQMSIEPEVFKLFPLLGLLTEVAPPTPPKLPERPKITNFKVGDIFTFPNHSSEDIVILQLRWEDSTFNPDALKYILGGNKTVLGLWSNTPMDREQILKWLNANEGKFLRNIIDLPIEAFRLSR